MPLDVLSPETARALVAQVVDGLTEAWQVPAAPEPLLVPDVVAARLCGRSRASWWRDNAAGRTPAAVKLGHRTLWRVVELREWIAAGCPTRSVWESVRKQGKRRN